MTFGYSNDLKHLLHPYVFVLKEGEIQQNLLDYKLMMLQVTCPEVIKSPTCTPLQIKPFPELDLLNAAFAEAIAQTQNAKN